MTDKEIEEHRQELAGILADTNLTPEERMDALEKLAQKVGASITRFERVKTETGRSSNKIFYEEQNVITETEIVHNIQVALQTATMINMCRTSSRNFWIALIATIVAVISAIAAWAAVVKN